MRNTISSLAAITLIPLASVAAESAAPASESSVKASTVVDTAWQVGELNSDKSAVEIKREALATKGLRQHQLSKPQPLVATTNEAGQTTIAHGARETWRRAEKRPAAEKTKRAEP